MLSACFIAFAALGYGKWESRIRGEKGVAHSSIARGKKRAAKRGIYRFAILHSADEGSHHACDILQRIPCVNLLKGEPFDKWATSQCAPGEQTRMLELVYTSNVKSLYNAWSDAYPKCKRQAEEILEEVDASCPPECEQRGVLVRVPVSTLCKLNINPIFMVRTDIMRWSLSTYLDGLVETRNGKRAHPQFNMNAEDASRQRFQIDLNVLEELARKHMREMEAYSTASSRSSRMRT